MTQEISYDVQGRTYGGYLADGANGKVAPAVLVIHEAGGLGPHARQKADRLAEMGYVAFAPDLFGADVPADQGLVVARQLLGDPAALRARSAAALARLVAQPNVDAGRLAAIGFCFGGTAAIELGRSGADLRAIVGFHSGLKAVQPEDSANIKAKVLVCVGDQDPLISGDDRAAFMENMSAHKIDAQLLLFTGVGHSFTNPDVDALGYPGIKYDALAEKRAWAAMGRLFAEVF